VSLDFTSDGFLGGRLTIAQPKTGFRAGHDAVLLAAAVPAKPGERVLELGSGSGVASLCLAARVAGLSVRGIEFESELVELANKNAERNGVADRVSFAQGDAVRLALGGETFDHVFFNPPFHPDTGQVSPIKARDQARRDQGDAVARWTLAALEATRTGGTVTAILRADRKDDVAEVVRGRGVTIFSLFPHAGEAPKRVLVRIVKGSDEPVRTAAGLVLHLADGKPTPEADAVLRHAAALSLA
jgi:tRNA1Val (adenine37-N6)-methyltransferase